MELASYSCSKATNHFRRNCLILKKQGRLLREEAALKRTKKK
ncbi:hypothetical protein HMPREF0973_00108 [Prevotella veroralis F0319]|uniref:Uncharacterized protein n=1 Tax=Prevotella veroralis F0319 TaxID=649761 RepID=C9MKK0_9BACT|nr:hypothetical protein HMPREF0973_00108 [Prevotella veroralis F0319]